MTTQQEISAYIAEQPAAKRADLEALHRRMQALLPGAKLWFLDGKNADGKVVTNPNVGYGSHQMKQAKGAIREFYQIGWSANTSGISVYIMGIDDRGHLPRAYGATIGKATVTGYCIKFKALKDIDVAVLDAAVRDGLAATG